MTEREESKARILSALNDYVNLGLPIIPVCSHDHVGYSKRHIEKCRQPGKSPVIRGWQTQEVTTMAQVKSWVQEFKDINIGLPLGHISGYVGIDVDGELGEDLLMEMSSGDLPETWEYVTGAGRRLLYEIPVGMQTKKFVNAAEGDHEECSILAHGQQTILPPSIHHTGRIYEWLDGRSPDDIDCAPAPRWLLDLVRVDANQRPGTIDLTRPGATYTPPPKEGKEVAPLVVSQTTIPSEFMEYQDLPMDYTKPDTSYVGKEAKVQEKEPGLSPEELMQVVSSGGRDNHMTRIIGHFCAKFRSVGKDYIMNMAKNHNLQYCSPPLDEAAIEAKVNHFWEAEEMKSAHFKNLSADADEKKVFKAGDVAQVVLNILEEQGYVLKMDAEDMIIWMTQKTQGPWKYYDISNSAEAFQRFMRGPLTDPALGGDPKWWSRKNFGEVASAMALLLRDQNRIWRSNAHNVDTQTLEGYKYVPLAGGKLLDWSTGEVLPWDPETHMTYTLPIEYDPSADCPSWKARLSEWLPDVGAQQILQEFVGYSLIPYMGFEKALMIVGEGANGKSLFLETIQGMLGYEVVDSITMRQLFSKFGQVDLYGKILNIANEAAADYLKGPNADDFKNLVSGGRVKADVKNKSALTFNNTAKFIFAANHIIKTSDKSEGWHRRMLIVPFDQDFSKSETPKYEIMQALRAEYPGIFNWALEGLRRLTARKQFSFSATADRKMKQVHHANDIAADFYANCLEETSSLSVDGERITKGIPGSIVSDLFKLWCEYRENNTQKFKKVISEYLEVKRRFQKGRLGKKDMFMGTQAKTMCWINLKVHIKDDEFLDFISESIELPAGHPIKDYAIKRQQELEHPTAAPKVSGMPQTTASSN